MSTNRGSRGCSLEPPIKTKLFHFYGDIYEKMRKNQHMEPPFMHLYPTLWTDFSQKYIQRLDNSHAFNKC